uniref:Uncharacterized protein n=1 Tax=Megaselia scalaris TaxID=36166 RepID=T1GZH2_MEGSC
MIVVKFAVEFIETNFITVYTNVVGIQIQGGLQSNCFAICFISILCVAHWSEQELDERGESMEHDGQ